MTIEFEWNFGPVDVIDEGENAGVAKTIHWQCTGKDTEASVNPVEHIGTLALGEVGETFEPMIAYGEDGCQEQRLSWVNAVDEDFVTTTEASITNHLAERVASASVNKQTVA